MAMAFSLLTVTSHSILGSVDVVVVAESSYASVSEDEEEESVVQVVLVSQ